MIESKRTESLKQTKNFNLIKEAVWGCVLGDPSSPKSVQQVDLVLLRDLMLELQTFISYNRINIGYERRLASRRSASSGSVASSNKPESIDYTYQEQKRFQHIMQRFSIMHPRFLQQAANYE